MPALADREQRLRTFDRTVWVRLAERQPVCHQRARGVVLTHFDAPVQNVHNAGKPMPDEEDEELWVDPTQQSLAPNEKCPLTMKALLSIIDPVKCAPLLFRPTGRQ